MRPISNIVSTWFGIVMIVVVIFLGCLVAFTNFMSERLYGNKRNFFVVLMFAYAVYRGFRVYQTHKRKEEN